MGGRADIAADPAPVVAAAHLLCVGRHHRLAQRHLAIADDDDLVGSAGGKNSGSMPGRGMMRGGFGHAARYGRSVAGPQGWWDWPGSVGIGEAFHDLFHILRPVARDDHDVVAVCDDDEAGDSRSEAHTSALQYLMRI